MFLVAVLTRSRDMLWRLAQTGLVTLALASHGLASQKMCVVELPVYDAFGNRLEFKIIKVAPEDRNDVNLLSVAPTEITATNDQMSFSDRTLLGRVLAVTLQDDKGKKIKESIFLTQCPQRTSIRSGISEAYGDTAFETIRGQLAGCSFVGDWWIRATPMFGVSRPRASFDGRINNDGSFLLTGQLDGERHLLIIGKGKQPLKTVGANVTTGKINDAGLIDLAGACPTSK